MVLNTKIQDHDDEMVRLLKQIAQNTSDGGGGDTINIEAESGTQTTGTAVYMTTGRGGIVLDDDDWHEIELGFAARTVNLRFDGPINVAFAKPYDRGSRIIPMEAAESPFTIGADGANGIDTEEVWLGKAANASEDPVVHLIAYR